MTGHRLIKELGNFALDSARSLAKVVDPVHWAKAADKTVKTFYGTIKVVKDARATSTAEHMAVSLRQLRFEPSGIRELMRKLLLDPTPDLPAKIEARIDKTLKLLQKAGGEAMSSPSLVARNKTLLDKIQKIDEKKQLFYQLLGFDPARYNRMIHLYISSPSSVPLEHRRKMAGELDRLFDQVNAEISKALSALEATLAKAPTGKPRV
jgi:hypothetical protein